MRLLQELMNHLVANRRKLIGARYFNKGYSSVVGPLNSTFHTPRDAEGHGSHTLSTAAGNFVTRASVFGFGNGTAKGGSPRARVAAYKVCWPPVAGNECFDADILAAFDIAIHDGVDVLSVSLGGDPVPLHNDSVAIGSFHAVRHGIVVVCSAGNSGPGAGTVSNIAPWQITVGASTMDRQFLSYVVLGNKMRFRVKNLSSVLEIRIMVFGVREIDVCCSTGRKPLGEIVAEEQVVRSSFRWRCQSC